MADRKSLALVAAVTLVALLMAWAAYATIAAAGPQTVPDTLPAAAPGSADDGPDRPAGVTDDGDDAHDRDDDGDDTETVDYQADAAGTVRVVRTGTTLTVTGVTPNRGWTDYVERSQGREVEVEFRSSNLHIDFSAQYDDGEIRVFVTETPLSSAPPASSSDDDHDEEHEEHEDDDHDEDDDHEDEEDDD